jgi:Pyruvate/2-oxoglutarate dehydrogenase complex, dehydrogenase (E1) component, eukaryotic type, beta subunit
MGQLSNIDNEVALEISKYDIDCEVIDVQKFNFLFDLSKNISKSVKKTNRLMIN